MTVKRDYKRKKLNMAVKRELQMWLLLRILGVVIVSSLVAVLILYLYSRQEISTTFYSAHIQLRRVSDLLFPVLAAGGVVSLLSGLGLAIFLPQKIAGPVFRIQKGLSRIQAGDLTEEITLRKGDILTDLAGSVNDTTADYRTRLQALKSMQKELEQLAAALENEDLKKISSNQAEALAELQT
jgi:methyl-accepting chemotaxis protein